MIAALKQNLPMVSLLFSADGLRDLEQKKAFAKYFPSIGGTLSRHFVDEMPSKGIIKETVKQ